MNDKNEKNIRRSPPSHLIIIWNSISMLKMKKRLLEEDKDDKKKLSEDDRPPTSLSVTYSFGTVTPIIVAPMFLHQTEDHINTCQMFYFDYMFR